VAENGRDREIAESTTALEVAKAELNRKTAVALAEANAASEKRKLELQKEVEMFRNSQQTEAMRAKDMSSANVNAEVKVRSAEGFATARIIEAEAAAKAIKVEAEAKAMATKLQAEADAEATKMKAMAHLVEQENEAKGIYALRQAEAEGLTKLIESAGGAEHLNSYLVVHKGILEKIAEQQSKAVSGMNPNITVVQGDGKMNGLSGTMHDILNTGVPLLNSLKHATGLDLLRKV
jgi:flotillin